MIGPNTIAGLSIGTFPQWGVFSSLLIIIGASMRLWIKGIPERLRAHGEVVGIHAKIEEDLRGEAAARFQEFRNEVHELRNELAKAIANLHSSEARSMRRGDKLNMVLFVIKLVMDELRAKDPSNMILQQAKNLLDGIEKEPHDPTNSNTLNRAEDTVEAAKVTVRQVKADEAKGEAPK